MNDNTPSNDFNRRDFLKNSSLATIMTVFGGVELLAQADDKPAEVPAGSKVRVGLIGCGAWGREVLKTLGRLTMVKDEVVAICDTFAPAMKKCSADAPGAKLVADYKELLADKTIQAVIIATPTHLHRDIAIAAIQAGKHVYCEVPLAHTIEDARDIARAAVAAPKQIFQSGLQMRSDKQRVFLVPFFRADSLGNMVMVRGQWHRMTSWRSPHANPEREKAINWRLDRKTSHGLMGEVGIHQLDQVGWFLKGRPKAVTGFGSLVHWKDDGRDVPDTVHAIFEYPKGVRFAYDATLASSFDADYESYAGIYSTVMMRENKAWLFKEVDSPMFGWEVYCRKDAFFRETGISLKSDGSKQKSLSTSVTEDVPVVGAPLYQALENFLKNVFEQDSAIKTFIEDYGADDEAALMAKLEKEVLPRREPAASATEGFHATVTAIKANEAVLAGQRLELKNEWYQL